VGAVAAANTVAITEFLNNADGEDTGREFVELYNYGDTAVNMNAWRLYDEDTDSYVFGDVTIGAGDFLIVVAGDASLTGAEKKALFETEWLGGTVDDRVLGIDHAWALGNSSDEIYLAAEDSTVIWNLAYSNDESNSRATFLTADDYVVNAFGDKATPGIVREGFDNGSADFLGYESNDSALAVDPNAYESTALNWASPFFVGSEPPPPEFTLTITGDCPGAMQVAVSGATANGMVALIYAVGTGNIAIPAGNPCAGTELGLDMTAKLYNTYTADANGDLLLDVNVPGQGCGLNVQALDVTSCETSNVDQL
jgi:hypothetical protein